MIEHIISMSLAVVKTWPPLQICGSQSKIRAAVQVAASVDYCKQLIIDPTFCGSRFSTGGANGRRRLYFFIGKLFGDCKCVQF